MKELILTWCLSNGSSGRGMPSEMPYWEEALVSAAEVVDHAIDAADPVSLEGRRDRQCGRQPDSRRVPRSHGGCYVSDLHALHGRPPRLRWSNTGRGGSSLVPRRVAGLL